MTNTQDTRHISLLEHKSAHYAPRTWFNATECDITIAIAADLTTAGERLTHKAAASRYIGFTITARDVQDAGLRREKIEEICQGVSKRASAKVINFAGNGIYTLSEHGIKQDEINLMIVELVAELKKLGLEMIRSGGQTGVDWAAAVAAGVHGINAEILFPNGFVQRGTDKRDVTSSQSIIRKNLESDMQKVETLLGNISAQDSGVERVDSVNTAMTQLRQVTKPLPEDKVWEIAQRNDGIRAQNASADDQAAVHSAQELELRKAERKNAQGLEAGVSLDASNTVQASAKPNRMVFNWSKINAKKR